MEQAKQNLQGATTGIAKDRTPPSKPQSQAQSQPSCCGVWDVLFWYLYCTWLSEPRSAWSCEVGNCDCGDCDCGNCECDIDD